MLPSLSESKMVDLFLFISSLLSKVSLIFDLDFSISFLFSFTPHFKLKKGQGDVTRCDNCHWCIMLVTSHDHAVM